MLSSRGNAGSIRHGVWSTLQLLRLNRPSRSSHLTHGSPQRPVVDKIGSSASYYLRIVFSANRDTFDCFQR
ncbi:hypothetical protein T01_8436 [Trichinella spiralis]|uniref:Uncharacterized protein n=1 Tax=Trichinella spiralis TaxID=6334 RepID=A0A0V1ARG9_TRISP|nr:hypothetical protein T01_8436 [Trichinella spiralis]